MKTQHNYLLEICCYSASDVQLAAQGGAQRVELCNGYEVGGTTPSLGNLILAKSVNPIPVYVMIRPRGGNFVYTSMDKKVMLKDIELAILNKADGIVFGALTEDGTIDKVFCKEVMAACEKVPTTFHRAIDLCKSPIEAIDFLVEIGVQNILTSGAQTKAEQGIELLQQMHDFAKSNIQIMAGSGVNAENILSFAQIGFKHFHSSASIIQKQSNQSDKIAFNAGLNNNELAVVSINKVKAMVHQLNTFFGANEVY
jgi:copper homeostasis protein